MAYSKKVVDKFENTINEPAKYNVGRFDPKEMNVGTGMVGAPACGDVMKLQIKCESQGNTHVIKDVKFKTAKYNVGRFDPKEMNVGTGMVGAPACGDVMKLQIKCESQGNTHIIKDVKFKTYGCGSAIASSSELVEMLIGKTLEEAKEIKNIDIVEALELPPIKIHCSVLAEDSIKQAIEDYEQKQ